ncbi:MAG: T9SS type A sorting domain-containing protein [Bacteroidia bacterium]
MKIIKIILIAVCTGCSFYSTAQLMTNNNVQITVAGSAQVTVKGDVQNNAGTTIANNATIDLTGDWINNSGNNCFGISQGTVILNGANQLIRGNTQTVFNNLNLTGGTKTLQINTTTGGGNVTPAGILACNNAVLDLNSNTLTVNNSNCNAISNTTGYILSEDADNSSKLTWKIGATTGTHTIPFGNASATQIPCSINATSGSLGDVTVSTYKTVPNNTPYPVAPTLVTHVHNMAGVDNSANTVDRFWQIDRTGSGIATYTLAYASTENAANGNMNMRAQCWNNTPNAWEAPLAGQSNPTTQSVTVPGVIQSGAWAVALFSSPLPIQLLSFSAKEKDNKNVVCNWSTATEINNDHFTVMRSKNGISFEEIGKVDGAGNSNSVLDYSYTDLNPYHGVSYYRLKQTDFNGTISYSKIESVLITDEEIKYAVFPNPTQGNIFIKFSTEENTNANYTITDAAGRLVANGRLNNLSGIQEVSLINVLKGFYFLRITNGSHVFTSKLEVIN